MCESCVCVSCVCERVVCERVVCERELCVRELCVRELCVREMEAAGRKGRRECTTKNKSPTQTGNKGNNVPACVLPGPVPLCLKWTPLDSYKLPLIKRNTATGKSNGLLLSSPKYLYETHGKSKEK